MIAHRLALGAALLVFAGAGAATAQQPTEAPAAKPQRQCFWTRDVNSFSAVDEKTVNVRVGVRDYYQFEMLGRCPDVDWSNEIALISRNGSSICSGMDATIVTKSSLGPQRCAVKAVRKLSPEDVAALSAKKAKP